jgi:hypothetical protein
MIKQYRKLKSERIKASYAASENWVNGQWDIQENDREKYFTKKQTDKSQREALVTSGRHIEPR